MATRRVIKSVLGNFLGTYVSRYSDYDGYLLFGFLVGDLVELRINLFGQSGSDPNTPVGVAVLSAVAKSMVCSSSRRRSYLAREMSGGVCAWRGGRLEGWAPGGVRWGAWCGSAWPDAPGC
jgi:hypothetical protein